MPSSGERPKEHQCEALKLVAILRTQGQHRKEIIYAEGDLRLLHYSLAVLHHCIKGAFSNVSRPCRQQELLTDEAPVLLKSLC